ncbi:molybdenum cofactor biosynthesis protein A [Sulfolobus islandicus Y.G.57.14]|jgi:cyclic pyranopterin phosphate synthase|uniref:Probable GTP 3',8-cyclase n=3 Tax=Saccharolobus islandicus TaxID=43080 RepID=MOAA_SACI2|nr:GTP 3',8-cyclase MoaA [Sulfolobus islandicus]C3MR64.1 RecName: Full=Probable GTP 3',8-cyclase; AltName: Full=Molybdenum cofactor biosynthesis protein A [Sulfolobus islandicus L.S.2.15]C3N7B9.1 RecName: Full=Probable GTP 3',8-cyclase; AltName: Full=Molybdenum cofactor biosynthesis protein A [Sulfolobus islandicus Y.G.57.14]ACP35877.1 molybdenum cofactor biosynthesis protein A [Sulfolobus islandicus L.S.2.15]ACP46113.1 molybdenum cofactor biosynthesis protein A [Sulfolobus islandicus Y.G.57.14
MIDRFGRPLEDLRITLTHVCNFECFFCHMEGEEGDNYILSKEDILLVAKVAKNFDINSVKLTGGEPTLRRDLVEIVRGLKQLGYRDVSMTTNGFLLKDLAYKLKLAGLDRINVSLHAISRETFKKITGVDAFDRVIEGIKSAIDVGLVPVKLNFVVNRRNREEVFKFIELSQNLGVNEIHLIELHPVGLGKLAFKEHDDLREIEEYIEKISIKKQIRKKHFRPRYVLPSGLIVEVIKPYANPIFCAGCNRIRLSVDGKLKTCLYREDNVIDILDILKGEYSEDVKEELLGRAFMIAIAIREPNFKYKI